MAKRVNKQIVAVLTGLGMLVLTGVAFAMLMALPGKDPDVWVERAKEAEAKADYNMAMNFYRRAHGNARQSHRPPEEVNSYMIAAGDMALKAGDAAAALNMWQDAFLSDPNSADAQERIVKLYVELAKLQGRAVWSSVQKEATTLLEIPGQEKNYLGLYALGRALIEQRAKEESNAERGREKLVAAFEGDKSNHEYADSLAQYYASEGRFAEATDIYDQLLDPKNRPEEPEALAAAYRVRGQHYLREQRRLTNELAQRSAEGAIASVTEGLQERIDATSEKAREDLEESVRLAPKVVESLVALGAYWHVRSADEGASDVETYRQKADELYREAIKTDPQDFSGYLQLANLYSQKGQLEEAVQVLDERMERGIVKEHYLGWLNAMLMGQMRERAFQLNFVMFGRTADTPESKQRRDELMGRMEKLYNITVAEAPTAEYDPSALFMKGRIAMLKGDKHDAIKQLEEAMERSNGGTPALRQLLASLYLETDSPGLAVDMLESLVGTYPANAGAWTTLARVYLKLDRNDKAREAAMTSYQLNPRDPETLAALSESLRRTNELELLNQILPQGEQASTRDKLMRAIAMSAEADNEESGDPEMLAQSKALLREVLAEDPLNLVAVRQLTALLSREPDGLPEVRKLVADTRAKAEARRSEALADADKTALTKLMKSLDLLELYAEPDMSEEEKARRTEELLQDQNDPYETAVSLYELYRRLPNREEDAFEQLKKAYELKPSEPSVVNVMFRHALARKDWDTAQECIRTAVEHNLDQGNGHFFRGQYFTARANEGNNLTEAIREFREGLAIQPNNAMGYIYLGNVLLQKQSFDEATRAFEEAARINPGNHTATVGLAMVASARGDEAEADRLLEICMRVAPNHAWVKAQMQIREDQRDPNKGIARREGMREAEPDDIDNLLQLADLYIRAKRFEDARGVLDDALARHPQHLGLVNFFARFLRTKTPPEPAVATEMIRTLIDGIEAGNVRDRAAAQIILAKHLSALALGRFPGVDVTLEDADAAFLEARRISDLPETLVDIGLYFVGTGRSERGEEFFKQAISNAVGAENAEIRRQARTLQIEAVIRSNDASRVNEAQALIDAYRKEYPDDKTLLLFQGELDLIAGRDASAIQQFTTFINEAPNPVAGLYRRGHAYFRRSQWSEAIDDLREIKRLAPEFSGYAPRQLLAKAYQASGRTEDAITELNSIIKESPDNNSAVQDLFNVYVRGTPPRFEAAQRLIEPKMAEEPKNPVWPNLLGQLAASRGDAARAIELGRLAVKLSDGSETAVHNLLRAYNQFEMYDDAIGFITNEVPVEDHLATVHLHWAAATAGKGDMAKGVDHLLQAFDAPDRVVDNQYDGFEGLVAPRLNLPAAIAELKKRLDAKPDHIGALFYLSILERRQGNMDDHIQTTQRLLELTPKGDAGSARMRSFLLRQLALARLERKEYPDVLKLYEETIAMNPNNVLALNNMAVLLMDHMNQPTEAMPYSKRAYDLSPSNPAVLDTLAWNHILLGNYEEGIGLIRRAMGISSEYATFHYHLAEAYYRRSQSDDPRVNSQDDLREAQRQCRIAHEMVMKVGVDREQVFDDILKLAGELKLQLPQQLPVTAGTR